MQATKPLPQINPQVVGACKERDPNFGKGRHQGEDRHVDVPSPISREVADEG
jgi:hypothetical protein